MKKSIALFVSIFTSAPIFADGHIGIGSSSLFDGEVITNFTGDSGHNNTWQNGSSVTSTKIEGQGSLCGFSCQDGSTSASSGAMNSIAFEGEAGGMSSGDLVGSGNRTQSLTGVSVDDGSRQVGLAGVAAGQGEVSGVFGGDVGNVITNQSGENGVSTEMQYQSGLCPDGSCNSGTTKFSGFSWNKNNSAVFASGNTPGNFVGSSSKGGSQSFTGFDFMKK